MLLDACPDARSVRPRDVSLFMHTLFEDALERDTERERGAALHRPTPADDTLVTNDASDERAFQRLTRSVPVAATAPTDDASTHILAQNVRAAGPRRGRRVFVAIATAAACIAAIAAGARWLGSDDTKPATERDRATTVSPPASEPQAEPVATKAVTDPVEPPGEAVAEPRVEPAEPSPRVRSPSRPRRAPREAPAARPPGRLTVATVPWATIEVDGRSYGQTPRTIELPAGPHTVVLRAEGESPTRRLEVTVPPGGVVARRVTFEP
jgi:hypothetical protein